MRKGRRVLALILATVMLSTTLGGCKEKEPEVDYAALAAEAAAKAEAERKDKAAEKIGSIPNPEMEDQDQEFFNELEELDNQLLLPLAIKIPEVQATSTHASVYIGANYNISPNSKWQIKCDANRAIMHHADGIAVQMVVSKSKGKFEPPQISDELQLFYDSFVEKGDAFTQDIFVADKLSGKQISFVIQHDNKDLRIIAGAITRSGEVLVYTINYFVENEATTEELVNSLLSTLQVKNSKVIRK